MNTVVFDIGATTTRIAASRDLQSFSEPIVYYTPADYEEALAVFLKHVASLEKPDLVVGGLPGVVNSKVGMLARSHLKAWEGKPFGSAVSSQVGSKVVLENDAALVGLGEAVFGAGKENEIVVYITVSTGVGGVRVVHKKIDSKSRGFEPGRQIIYADRVAKDFHAATLEGNISGREIQKQFGQIPSNIHDMSVWTKIERELAIGLHNTVAFWSPDCIVLGGGLVLHADLSLERVARQMQSLHDDYAEPPRLLKASLGEFGGLYGSLVLAGQVSVL